MVWPGDVLHDIESEVEKMKKGRLEITEKVKAQKTQRQVRLLTAHKGIPALSTAGPKLAEAKLGQSHRVFLVCPEVLEEAGPTPWASPAPSSVSLPVIQRLEWAKSQQTSDSDLLLVSDGRNKELRGKIEKALGPSGSDTVEEFIVVFGDAARFKGPVQNAPGWMTFFLRSRLPLGLQKREDSRQRR